MTDPINTGEAAEQALGPKIGRPTGYSIELAETICERLAQGMSMRTVAKADDMPCAATIFSWLRLHPAFLEQYTRAKHEAADALVEEMVDIADDATNDWMETHDKDGDAIGWKLNGDHVQRSRLRIETRKWLASKLKPKKYGERLELAGNDDSPLRVVVQKFSEPNA